ncbi:intermediate filament protein [Scheffersomyces stipitis CBS 6054]|uniref:Intermediate filament protein n=1 Tax=Scheffersomyces stipitis (strain ATCC 58785 / CBS 6054 / NBRC 10063 / NRRL Y-11545) TaxID=322104 RepID=A3LV92_PICST|nr:intermediate filament protein [Scheffersomyces stipitis CBS 6054]ABN67086.2 intermediate filament protein [Scheffersomyces stipitis CBS 6054]
MVLQVFGYSIVFFYVLRYTFIYWALFAIGGFLSLAIVGYFVIFVKVRKPIVNNPKVKRFKFVEPSIWNSHSDSSIEKLNKPIIADSFLVSETLEEFIDLIIKEFVDSWFKQVSKDSSFQDSIKVELKSIFTKLISRLADIDYARLLVSQVLPIVNEHFIYFTKAEETVRVKGTVPKSETPEYHLAIANQFDRGRLHPGVTVSNLENNDTNEKNYLRSKIASILPYLLSEQERSNEIVTSLVTEIVACTILTSILQMVGEGDFYNLLIVKLVGDNLKHRDQVKRLREALKEHTEMLAKKQSRREDEGTSSTFMITENTDIPSFKEMMSNVNEIDTNLIGNLSLSDILPNPRFFKVFSEFMKDQNRLEVLQFWKEIDSLRAPLEESALNEDGEVDMSVSLEFTSTDDIRRILDHYSQVYVNSVSKDLLQDVENLSNESSSESKLIRYQKARKTMFKVQQAIFNEMVETDLPAFKKSDLGNIQAISKNERVNPEVIQAVEDAFTKIMKDPSENENRFSYDQKINFSEKQAITAEVKKELFLFGYDSTEGLNLGSNNRSSKLFDDLSDESGTDTDSMTYDSDSQVLPIDSEESGNPGSEVFWAAPGNLNLAEEIPKLTDQIEKLNEQVKVLIPLIRKAELTNNISELKILTKSKVSVEREINSKELQKQQYIVQENDNSLYGKSRVSIQSYISGSENGKEFILYIVEVQKFSSNDPSIVRAGWVVARRFSQFFKLHEYLKLRYPQVSNIRFPKRTMSVLKFQQRQLVELRKIALEEYLQLLIQIPEVCSNKAFRSFLSSENFTLRKNQTFEDGITGDGSRSKNNVELVANKLYNGISTRLVPNFNTVPTKAATDVATNEEMMDNIKDMQQELKWFDEYGSSSSKEVFVKPICDLLISVFRLNNSKSWLRGRALVLILQQLFGTTIEKKTYEQVDLQLKTEEKMLDLLINLQNIVFPNGKFKDPPVLRTLYQRSTTRQEARVLLGVFMNETCSRIFGTSNTNFASTKIFSMIQNDFLNKHLILQIIDELVAKAFPELT